MKAKTSAIVLTLIAGAVLFACSQADNVDDCSYTWYQARPPSVNITVIAVKDESGMPDGPCKTSIGCTLSSQLTDDRWVSTIYINESKEIKGWGACNTRRHELRHANGEAHEEKEMYTPRDLTRH